MGARIAGVPARRARVEACVDVDPTGVARPHASAKKKPSEGEASAHGPWAIQSNGALRATNLRIIDVDARGSGGIVQNTYYTVTTPPLSGHYRIQHNGNPQAAPGLAAPAGSHFIDTATGTTYVKTGSGAQDWDEIALVP